MPLNATSLPESRPSAEEWRYQFLDFLNLGINSSRSSRNLAEGEVLIADNIRFLRDSAIKDQGYITFGQTVEGRPRATFELFLKSGSSFLTLITNTRFYVWNTTSINWDYTHDGTSTTLSADEPTGSTLLTVTSIVGFANADVIGVRLDDGSQHKTTVSGAPSDSTITIADALPSPAASGNTVLKATILAGSDVIQPSITAWAATNRMYFTNGADAPKWFDGNQVDNVAGLPGNFKARVVAVHVNHLILMHTEEGGAAHPQRERWSEPGVDNSWNTSVNFVDHFDTESFITAAKSLGVYLIIYKERELIRQEFVGAADQTWNWITTIEGEGIASHDSIINLGDIHLFWGNSNVYRYRGGFGLEAVGDNIFDTVFSSSTGNLNPDKKEHIFVVYVEELDEAWFFYPTSLQTFPTKFARLVVSTGAWSFRDLTFNVTGFGFFAGQTGKTWLSGAGSWASQLGPWVGSGLQAGAPTIHLCDGINNRVYEYDFFSATDNGAAIPFELQTRDWYMPNRDLRFDRFDFYMRGTGIVIDASFDEGNTFINIGTVSSGANFIRQRLFLQHISNVIRFKFSGTGAFGLKEIGFTYKRESIT